jgi:hypothetical protein
MRLSKILLINLVLVVSSLISKGQTTTIDFTTTPYLNNGNNTWDPNYWDNGGCASRKKFGPNPLPLNGHNIRAVGGTYMNNYLQKSFILSAARNGVDPHVEVHNDWNAILSIEYSFSANKSYIIEFKGLRSEGAWDSNYNQPARYKKCVFWIKLDDSPVISTPSLNPCGYDLHPVEKSVGRYSKLIADPSMAFADKTYSVKFSPKENKSALKIIHDPSPADPNLSFHSQFALYYVKITEVPYEEESGRYNSTYLNAPFPPRGTPGYDIPVILDNPTSQPGRIVTSISVNPNQWGLNTSSTGYSLNLSQLVQNLKGTNLVNISLMTGRPTRGGDGSLNLPCTSLDNNYSFNMTSNNDVIINVTNPTNTAPNTVINFNITYNNP